MVENPGRFYLASHFPGEWATRTGELATREEVHQQATGSLPVSILRWESETVGGLKKLAARSDAGGRIAVSLFQRRERKCESADIAFACDGEMNFVR